MYYSPMMANQMEKWRMKWKLALNRGFRDIIYVDMHIYIYIHTDI